MSEILDAKWFNSVEALRIVEYRGASKTLQKAIDRFIDYLKDVKEDITC